MKATREPAARNFRADLLPKNWPVGIPHDEPAHKRDRKAAVAREPGRALRNKFRMPAVRPIDAAAPAALTRFTAYLREVFARRAIDAVHGPDGRTTCALNCWRAHCCTLRGRPMGLVGRSSWACAAI